MRTLLPLNQPPLQALFSGAAQAYITACRDRGLAPAPISLFKSRLSQHFVELRTETNGKVGLFFPATGEWLSYLDPPKVRADWSGSA